MTFKEGFRKAMTICPRRCIRHREDRWVDRRLVQCHHEHQFNKNRSPIAAVKLEWLSHRTDNHNAGNIEHLISFRLDILLG